MAESMIRGNVRKSGHNGRRCCPGEDRKTVAGWLRQTCDEVENNEERYAQNESVRYHRCAGGCDTCDEKQPEEPLDLPLCTKNLHAALGPSTSRGSCPRKDVIAKLAPTVDMDSINEVVEQVANEEITTAAEFIFSLTPYVRDRGLLFHEILEKELNYFRDIVKDTVDRRVQDEADVMMHTQNKIKNKFKSLTLAMTQRTMRIRQRLNEISPKFNWAVDGRDKAKLSKLIIAPLSKRNGDETGTSDTANSIGKLTHQVFMRGQWLKKELTRLQEENKNLQIFLDKFRNLASERKEQESYVPRILSREKEELERELNELRKTYKRNLEIIDALYVEHHRCIKPASEVSIFDGR